MKPIYIHIISYFQGHTGYNVHAREFTKAMTALVAQFDRPVTVLQTSATDPAQRQARQQQLQEQAAGADIINIALSFGSLCGPLLQNLPGWKIAYTVWESTHLPDDWLVSLQYCDYVWTTSRWGVEVLVANGLPPDRLAAIPEGVDPALFNPQQQVDANLAQLPGFKFFTVGKCEARKGTIELIRAFDMEFYDHPEVFLVLSIDNPFIPNFRANEFVTSLWLRNPGKFIYAPKGISHQQLAQMMATCDCGVFPTKAEGWGLPILESLALGKPTITTNYSAVTEYAHQDNALLLDYLLVPVDGLLFNRADRDYGQWALPNSLTLRRHMRAVYEHQDHYRTKFRTGAEAIARDWSWAASAAKAWQWLQDNLLVS